MCETCKCVENQTLKVDGLMFSRQSIYRKAYVASDALKSRYDLSQLLSPPFN